MQKVLQLQSIAEQSASLEQRHVSVSQFVRQSFTFHLVVCFRCTTRSTSPSSTWTGCRPRRCTCTGRTPPRRSTAASRPRSASRSPRETASSGGTRNSASTTVCAYEMIVLCIGYVHKYRHVSHAAVSPLVLRAARKLRLEFGTLDL